MVMSLQIRKSSECNFRSVYKKSVNSQVAGRKKNGNVQVWPNLAFRKAKTRDEQSFGPDSMKFNVRAADRVPWDQSALGQMLFAGPAAGGYIAPHFGAAHGEHRQSQWNGRRSTTKLKEVEPSK
jgi:hypothetical protein